MCNSYYSTSCMHDTMKILCTFLLILTAVTAELWTLKEYTDIQNCFVNEVQWQELLNNLGDTSKRENPFTEILSTVNFPMSTASSSSACNFHEISQFKLRFNALDNPEKWYEFNFVECFHSSKLFDDTNNKRIRQTPFQELQASITEANVLSPFGATVIPQSFYFATLSEVAATVCVSEYVEGIPLEVYAFSLDSDLAVFHFVMAMLGSLDTLIRLQIVHRDINPGNMAVHFDKQNRPSLVVFDFTWAISPGIGNEEPLPAHLNCVYRHPSGTHRSDFPSMGLVIRDMLLFYASEVEVDWLSPLVDTMLDRDQDEGEDGENNTPDTFQLGMQLLDLFVKKELGALQGSESGTGASCGGRGGHQGQEDDSSSYSYLEHRRRELCQQPNYFSGKAQLLAKVVDVEGTTRDATVTGYQGFRVVNSPEKISLLPQSTGLIRKDELLSGILRGTVSGLSVMDIGGNVGYFCAFAVQFGATKATIVDMDSQYTTVAAEMYQFLGSPFADRVVVKNKKLSDLDGSGSYSGATAVSDADSNHNKYPYAADVVIALDLIHWSFSCSETTGSLARTIGNLAIRARKMLIIEWIDPSDYAIQGEDRLGMGGGGGDAGGGQNHFHSPYTKEEFLRVMRRIFNNVGHVGNVTSTRQIYIGRHKYGRFLNNAANSGSNSDSRDGRHRDDDNNDSNDNNDNESEKYRKGDAWWSKNVFYAKLD